MAKTGRDSAQFQLRLPADLRELIVDQAVINGRSINAEIVSTLEDFYLNQEHIHLQRNDIIKLGEIAYGALVDEMAKAILLESGADIDIEYFELSATDRRESISSIRKKVVSKYENMK